MVGNQERRENPEISDENKLLKIGYAGILHESFPFKPADVPSYNKENAYISDFEAENLGIPPQIEFPKLKSSIPEKHHERLETLWLAVEANYYEFLDACEHLKSKWTEKLPEFPIAPETAELLNESDVKIRPELQKGVLAIISTASRESELRRWQREEKALRKGLYERSKIFIVSLRIYTSMLLETEDNPEVEGEKEYVLPENHTLRAKIIEYHINLRIIDARQSGLSIGKAAHHAQKTGRLRKTEKKPYIVHSLDVTNAALYDVLPHIRDNVRKEIFGVIFGIVGPVHDTVEDTGLALEELINNYIKRLADVYDSSIDQLITSGFPENLENSRENIKKRVLNLLREDLLEEIKQILRILSNNCQLNKEERIKMAKECLASKTVTIKNLNLTAKEIRIWRLKGIKQKPSKTFNQFPEEEESDDGKSSAFIMRHKGLSTSKEIKQISLIFKLEDRANNMLTLNNLKPDKKRKMLRTTTSRIIAYAMLEHDNLRYPLYDALPRCIEITLQKYEEFEKEHPRITELQDRRYIAKLIKWQADLKRNSSPKTSNS